MSSSREFYPGPGEAQRGRLPSLTSLRFFAAGAVFVLHFIVVFFVEPPIYAGPSMMVFWGGTAGVNFFFILSGFVLAWSAQTTDSAGRFWRRRFVKIYPNHLLTFLAAVILLLSISIPIAGGTAALNLTLLHAWWPSFDVIGSINTITWSLSCEAFFYLLFPLLYKVISRIDEKYLWHAVGAVIAAVFIIPSLSKLLPNGDRLPFGLDTLEMWFIYMLPPVRLLDFVLGILMARIVLTGQRLPITFPGALVLLLVGLALTPLIPPRYAVVAALTIPMALVIATAANADIEGRRTGLSGRGWILLGEISFAFYMWHWIVIQSARSLTGADRSWGTSTLVAIGVILFAATVLISYTTFVWYERPIMRCFGAAKPQPTQVTSVHEGDPRSIDRHDQPTVRVGSSRLRP